MRRIIILAILLILYPEHLYSLAPNHLNNVQQGIESREKAIKNFLIRTYLFIPLNKLARDNSFVKDIYGGRQIDNPEAIMRKIDPYDSEISLEPSVNPIECYLQHSRFYDSAIALAQKIDILFNVYCQNYLEPLHNNNHNFHRNCWGTAKEICKIFSTAGYRTYFMKSNLNNRDKSRPVHFYAIIVDHDGTKYICDFEVNQFVIQPAYGSKYLKAFLSLIKMNQFMAMLLGESGEISSILGVSV